MQPAVPLDPRRARPAAIIAYGTVPYDWPKVKRKGSILASPIDSEHALAFRGVPVV